MNDGGGSTSQNVHAKLVVVSLSVGGDHGGRRVLQMRRQQVEVHPVGMLRHPRMMMLLGEEIMRDAVGGGRGTQS